MPRASNPDLGTQLVIRDADHAKLWDNHLVGVIVYGCGVDDAPADGDDGAATGSAGGAGAATSASIQCETPLTRAAHDSSNA